METWQSFGEEIRRLRKRKGMSIRDLAEASGLGFSHIARIESGARNRPRPSTLRALEAGLGMPEGYLNQVIEKRRSMGDSLDASPKELVRQLQKLLPVPVRVYNEYPKTPDATAVTVVPLSPSLHNREDRLLAWRYTGNQSMYAREGDVLVYDPDEPASDGRRVVFTYNDNPGTGVLRESVIENGEALIARGECSNLAVVLYRIEILLDELV
jgi:transcriptional regulator with XRE-family HTH domain